MSHFQFETELQSALRMDSALTAPSSSNSSRPHRAPMRKPQQNSINRSLSESRLFAHPNSQQEIKKPRRSKTPTRLGADVSLGASLQRSHSSSTVSPSRLGGTCSDRFIVNRSCTDMEFAQHTLSFSRENLLDSGNNGSNENSGGNFSTSPQPNPADPLMDNLSEQLRRQKLSDVLSVNGGAAGVSTAAGNNGKLRILAFAKKAAAAEEGHLNNLKVLYSTGKPKVASAAKTRQVVSKPEKILDAPDLRDDFYLHLIDWSVNNELAVTLGSDVFIWNAPTGSITQLCSHENFEQVTSLKWVKEGGSILAIGDYEGNIDLWDIVEQKMLREMPGHAGMRVPVMDWNNYLLAAGAKDGSILIHDVRVPQHLVHELQGHSQEVCGLAWAPGSDSNLLASGANDNLVLLWDKRSLSAPISTFNQHQSAIKAVSWCPWHPKTLATGGGTSDRTIKFWNTSTGTLLNSVHSGSQVSSLVWNSEYRELLSGHGFSHFQLSLWRYPQMTKVADLQGHTARVLMVCPTTDGQIVASAAADETIRLWRVWPEKAEAKSKKVVSSKSKEALGLMSQRVIR